MYSEDRKKKQYSNAYLCRMVNEGKLLRKNTCECCGGNRSRYRGVGETEPRKIHAHHENYDKPLSVKWYCALCHTRIHIYKRKGFCLETAETLTRLYFSVIDKNYFNWNNEESVYKPCLG